MKAASNIVSKAEQLSVARDLVWAWTDRTIRGRYQQSVMGWLWAVIQPAATAAIFTAVFTLFVKVDTGGIPYVLFSYLVLVPWTFFSSSLTDMADSLVQNMSLITKIYFPREALPLSAMLARLLDFAVAAGLIVIMIVYFQISINPILWLYLPIILLVQTALILGLGLVAAALNVFFRDVQPLLKLVIQLWFYASPIIYPVTLVPADLRPFYYLNPMTGILEAYRDVLLYATPPGSYLYLSTLVALVLLVGGYWVFKRVEFRFADIV